MPIRYRLTASFDVGERHTLTTDTSQECRNELAELIAAAARAGREVVAWHIEPAIGPDEQHADGIAARNTGT